MAESLEPLPLTFLKPKPAVESHGCFGSFRIMFRYLLADLKKKQRAFRIGFITVLLVVAFVTALESGIQSVPLVFLKLAENEVGETDLVMTPTKSIIYNPPHAAMYFSPSQNRVDNSTAFSLAFLNHTEIEEKLEKAPFIAGASPRWVLLGRVQSAGSGEENTSVKIVVANTSREIKIGLGRNFPKRALKDNQVIVSSAALHNLGLSPQSKPSVELTIDLLDIMTTLLSEVTSGTTNRVVGPTLDVKGSEVNLEKMDIDLQPYIIQALDLVQQMAQDNGNTLLSEMVLPMVKGILLNNRTLSFNEFVEMCYAMGDKNPLIIKGEVEVVEAVESPKGKWPDALGKVMLMDDSYLLPFILNSLSKNLLAILAEQNPIMAAFVGPALQIGSLARSINIEQFALTTQIVFKDRSQLYIQSKGKRDGQARRQLAYLATEVFGLEYRAKYELTLLASVDSISSFTILLNVIFMLVTFFLLLLSVLLIYSLMMSVRLLAR